MNPKKNTVAVTFRCDVAVADQLDELCRMMGIKRSEFLISAITSEYDKMQGNPKLKDMLEQFKQITETIFLSTLSLRRATAKVHKTVGYFCAYETNFMEIASSC